MTYAHNKKASFNYELLEKFEGGLVLTGNEVKAIKAKQVNFEGAYVIIRGKEAFLVGTSISPYQVNNMKDEYDPMRPRKILLSKKELEKLSQLDKKKGLTLVPISLYNKGKNIKLKFALARGKKKTDKRQSIKQREADIEIKRTLKNQR